MTEKTTEHYKMEFYDSYVVIERIGALDVNSTVAKRTIQIIVEHFQGREFVIISNRKSDYTMSPDAYSDEIFKKVKGIAIVSKEPQMKLKAILEQERFTQSFAYFENLSDAKDWAESFFVHY